MARTKTNGKKLMNTEDLKNLSMADLERMLAGGSEVMRRVEQLILERKLKIDGDDSHATVRLLRQKFADIDKPRDYDFQDVNHYEQQALQAIQPDYLGGVICDPTKVISGEATVTFAFRACCDCGASLAMKVCGDTVNIVGKVACESNAVYNVQVYFKTGQVMSGDWLTGLSEWKDHPDNLGKVDYEWGDDLGADRRYSTKWAQHNVAHFFVGNTCPNVVLTEDGRISIRPDEVDDAGTVLTNICTDLWWVTLTDLSNWERMMGDIGLGKTEMKKALDDIETFQIKPGYWNFRYETVYDGEFARRVTANWLHD